MFCFENFQNFVLRTNDLTPVFIHQLHHFSLLLQSLPKFKLLSFQEKLETYSWMHKHRRRKSLKRSGISREKNNKRQPYLTHIIINIYCDMLSNKNKQE